MKKTLICFAVLGLLAGCNSKMTLPEANAPKPIAISPILTKVTETNFEQGDAIGLTIIRESGTWASNAKLTYEGNTFSGDLVWYPQEDKSVFMAYYPYSETVPTSFTVALDQREGTSSSDFVAAIKSDVVPDPEAISMGFRHYLSRINVTINNLTDNSVEGVSFSNLVPTAIIGQDFRVSVADAPAAEIQAFKVSEGLYRLIAVPQTGAFTVSVSVGGTVRSKTFGTTELISGMEYSCKVIISDNDIEIALSGRVSNWRDGGSLPSHDEEIPVPEAVDLGLSVKWASFNLGASKPEEYGNYYAWGETRPKDSSYWSTYKWCEGSERTLTKYNTLNEFGIVDNKTTLDIEDDAAHVNLGGSWRIPTVVEISELHNMCTYSLEVLNGVTGHRYTSKLNGESIFIPRAGWNGGAERGLHLFLWTNEISYGDPLSAFIGSSTRTNRCNTCTIRPVCD